MPTRTALISVSDKTHVVAFARRLAALGVRLLSSGGTFKVLDAEGIKVDAVDAYTGSPEVMGGRVKTLHPRVHGGILAREGTDEGDLARIGAAFIDLVVVNLYPFERTLADPKSSAEELVENIDIGGPSMLRSAAKNHARVAVICDPSDYEAVARELESAGAVSPALRKRLAGKAFAHTAAYDAAISGWLSREPSSGLSPHGDSVYPEFLTLPYERAYTLRYGENPHQSGAFYVERGATGGSLARAESVGAGGKELSFNNLVDVNAALDAVREFDEPAAVVVKHTNPCGVAVGSSLVRAYHRAREADALSAFGGIVALNREVDEATAKLLAETFLECVIAPSYSSAALPILQAKKNLRVLATGGWLDAGHDMLDFRRVSGGIVVQSRDRTASGEVQHGKVATKKQPTDEQWRALGFAWRVCKHVKSNAIVLASSDENGAVTLGVGAGQMSRVVSVELAVKKAGDRTKGAVLASDAFFPFPDGLIAAAKAGIAAVAQPGGSVKDVDVIAAADEMGVAMVMTGVRHFRH
jgi:phosphoribosylaminoimidazolecarboxamide formyltransferase/IMP cyclohydrolase